MEKKYDLVVLGAGIMGQFAAYFAASEGRRVLLLVRKRIGNIEAGSSGITRSFCYDYLDTLYVKLALDARLRWQKFEVECGFTAVLDCGCLNLAYLSVTADLEQSYAYQCAQVLRAHNLPMRTFSSQDLTQSFPQFRADLATLDERGGLLDVERINRQLYRRLEEMQVDIVENVAAECIVESEFGVDLSWQNSQVSCNSLVISVGRWINQVLPVIRGNSLVSLPVSAERPIQCKYFVPNQEQSSSLEQSQVYSAAEMPVFACLDLGIYGHPIFNAKTKGVKIGMYRPHKMPSRSVHALGDWVATAIPELKNAAILDVTDTDQGSYQMTPDGDFVLGILPNFKRIAVGWGWCGTGYKFAPSIGRLLYDLSRGEAQSINLERFTPARFLGSKFIPDYLR